MSECYKFRESCESYALGALEGEERAAFEAHLATHCEHCRAELDRARALVAQLAYLAPEQAPPPHLQNRLMAAIAADAQRGPAPVTPRGSDVSPAAWWNWLSGLSWAAAAAALLFAVWTHQQAALLEGQRAALEIQLRQEAARLSQTRTELARYEKVLAIVSAPGTIQVSLDPAKPAAPRVRAHWNEKSGLVLTALQFPAPEAGRTFQLWLVPKKGNPISAGIFSPDARGDVFHFVATSARVAATAALAISVEPAGGSPQPTSTPIWVGALPSAPPGVTR